MNYGLFARSIVPENVGQNIINTQQQGRQAGLSAYRNRVMQEAGGQMAQGNMGQAKNTLYRSGDLQSGMGLEKMMDERRKTANAQSLAMEDRRRNAIGSLLYAIKTPEQFEKAKSMLSQRGVPGVDQVTFEDLPMLRSQFMSLEDQMKMDKISGAGNPLQNEREKARMRALGKAEGEAEAAYPKDLRQANQMLNNIDETLSDPALDYVVGPIQGGLPNMSGGAQRAQSRIDQLTNQTFLQAYQELKGGGAITDEEGKKAVGAFSRLSNQNLTNEDYRQAIQDLRDVIEGGRRFLLEKMGQDPGSYSPPPARQSPSSNDPLGILD